MRNVINVVLVIALVAGAEMTSAQAPAPTPAPAVAPEIAQPGIGEQMPTVEQLNQQLSEGKHQDVLRQVAKLLALKGEAAKAYDRYELFSLRGEAALRGKANSMAMEAFAQAAKASDDPINQSTARATEILIRRSKPLGYVPKTLPAAPAGGKVDAAAKARASEPIAYIESADRKRAFAALLADELAAVEPKIKAATKSNGLPPVIVAIKSLGDLRAIEVAASGSSEKAKAISGDLGSHAHGLISQALGPMKTRAEECWRQGSRRKVLVDRNDAVVETLYGMMGLTSTEQNDLKAIIATCERIQPVASEMASVTQRAELIADAQDARQLHDRAVEVLNFDYPNAGRYNKDPKR